MSKHTVVADAYLHEYMYHMLLDRANTDVLTDVALVPLAGYAQNVVSFPEADADILPMAYLAMREVKPSLSWLAEMIEYPDFVQQIVSFADELAAYGIAEDRLPQQDPLYQEIKALVTSIRHLPKPHAWIPAFHQASFSASHVSYVSSSASMMEAICFQALQEHHAERISLPTVTEPVMRLKKALNRRWEMEACIQDILLRQLPLEDVNVVLCGGSEDLPLWYRLCEQYRLPYGCTFASKPSSCAQGFCHLMDFLLNQTIENALALLQDTWLDLPDRQPLLTYLDRFVYDGTALWQPFVLLDDDVLQMADRMDRDAYMLLHQKAEQARTCLVQQIVSHPSPYQAAFQSLAESRLVQDEQELAILYQIKNLLETYAEHLHDRSLWPFFRHIINGYSISCIRSWVHALCVSDLNHPVPARKYGYVLNATQANYPNIPSPSGIFSSSYLESIPHYPTAVRRQTFYQQKAEWIFHMASDITCSYPTNDYEGKGKEVAAQLTLLIHEPAQQWEIRQADTKPERRFLLSEAAAERLWVKEGTVFGSVSSIESWFTCPFQHFLRYGLRVNPDEQSAMDARRAGTILHRVMEYAIKNYHKQYPALPETELVAVLKAACDPLTALYPKQALQIRLWQTIHLHQLQQTFAFLKEMEDATDFIPEYTEYAFEREVASFREHSLHLKGFIDRIDIDGDAVRILDYKSAKKSLHKTEVQHGVQLQLLTYLAIAASCLDKRPVGCYYVTFKHPTITVNAADIRLKPLEICDQAEVDWQQQWIKEHRLSGWTFAQHTGLDRTGTYVNCLKADGSVMPQYRYDPADLKPWIHETYQAFLQQLLQGTIAPTPLEGACALCRYRCICRNASRWYPTNYEPETIYFEKKRKE